MYDFHLCALDKNWIKLHLPMEVTLPTAILCHAHAFPVIAPDVCLPSTTSSFCRLRSVFPPNNFPQQLKFLWGFFVGLVCWFFYCSQVLLDFVPVSMVDVMVLCRAEQSGSHFSLQEVGIACEGAWAVHGEMY